MALASCYELFQRRGRKALHDLKMLILKACISAYLSDDALTEISPPRSTSKSSQDRRTELKMIFDIPQLAIQ